MTASSEDLEILFQQKIEKIFSNLSQKKYPTKLAVAVSGGSDSLALTLLLRKFCLTQKIKLFAVSVDHKMRETSSDELSKLNQFFCKQKISHKILEVDASKLPKNNIEAKLRESRYKLLYDFCIENKIKFLFLGHQLDDVAENFLIRLFRGSGLDGLSTIAEISKFRQIKLVRPLLNFRKDQIKNFLIKKRVEWFEDESNGEERFLRNKIRKFLDRFEEKNLIQERIKNTSDEIAKMRDSFDDAMLHEAASILEFNEFGYFLLNLKNFREVDQKIGLKILALVLMEVGGEVYKPRLEKLRRLYDWMVTSTTHKPKNFYGCMVERFDPERLIVYREKRGIDSKNIQKFGEKKFLIDGRFLVQCSQRQLGNLIFPDAMQLARIEGLKGISRKISGTILFENQGGGLFISSKPKFYFRTKLSDLFISDIVTKDYPTKS